MFEVLNLVAKERKLLHLGSDAGFEECNENLIGVINVLHDTIRVDYNIIHINDAGFRLETFQDYV